VTAPANTLKKMVNGIGGARLPNGAFAAAEIFMPAQSRAHSKTKIHQHSCAPAAKIETRHVEQTTGRYGAGKKSKCAAAVPDKMCARVTCDDSRTGALFDSRIAPDISKSRIFKGQICI
jgi:hypothetical protein